MLVAVIGLLWASSLHAKAFADQSDSVASTLNFGKNGIAECQVVERADGQHLILKIEGDKKGNSLHLEDRESNTYDYIFGYRTNGRMKGRPILSSDNLEHSSTIDILLSGAVGLKRDSDKWDRVYKSPIFVKPGPYTLYLGYNFRSNEEAMLGGVCQIDYGEQ